MVTLGLKRALKEKYTCTKKYSTEAGRATEGRETSRVEIQLAPLPSLSAPRTELLSR